MYLILGSVIFSIFYILCILYVAMNRVNKYQREVDVYTKKCEEACERFRLIQADILCETMRKIIDK